MKAKNIYLDYQATTPLDKRVLDAMMPFFVEYSGNPMSKHYAGSIAESAVEESRRVIANLINVSPNEVYFTSGATESINIAVKGLAFGLKEKGNHIITSPIEHKAVLQTCRYLSDNGFRVSMVDVDSNGFINISSLKKLINKQTILMAIGHANNEIGTIQNINEIGIIAKDNGIHFFVDAAQSFGKIPIEIDCIDSLALSGHKIYGPKGIGALIVKSNWRNKIVPLVHGGGQENGLRPGTHNVPLIVGLGEASKIAYEEMNEDNYRIKELRNYLWQLLSQGIEGVMLNGSFVNRLSGNLNFLIQSISSELVVNKLSDKFAFSTASACMSRSNEPSHVILALGKNRNIANSSIRVSLGRYSTKVEIECFAKVFIKTVNELIRIINF